LNWSKDSLVETITRAHQLGLQAHIHAIGDKAIGFALDAIDLAQAGNLPPVIAHAELTNSSLLARVKDKNISLCVQPYWAQLNDMLRSCIKHLGEDRTHALYAFKDMLQLGINVVFSSDWPVSSYKPFEGIAVAVNRRLQNAMPRHNEGQAINLEQALDAYTINNLKMLGKKASVLKAGDPFDAALIEGKLKQKNLGELASSKILAVYKSGVNLLP
jgi:predicted amidohydrolase YtcJ